MRRVRRVLCSVALVLLGGALVPVSASALVEQPFAARYSANENGAIWVTGSTLMTCPAVATCAAAQAGTATGAALNNNGYAMVPVDVDADPATFNSSSSTFTPPAGSEVLFAGLYFGGRVTAGGGGGAPAPNAAARGTALVSTPAGGPYVPVTGAVADSTAVAGAYVAFADVTALVRAGGAGRYGVANVQAGTGLDRYAGWSLVVVYRDAALPLRNLSVFDGLAAIQQLDPPLSIGVSGFRTPLGGPVRTSVGIVAYEGDRGSAGDRLALNGTFLRDAANLENNLFNSSVAFEGTNTLAQRLPPYVNALGFDADRIVADGLLANGATSATLQASTTQDQYLIQVATFTTDLSAPRLAVAKSVADLDGGEVEPGDVLRYTLTTRNDGDDAALGVAVQDAVPAGTTLVPGSLAGGGGAAAPDGRSVSFAAGTLAPAASATQTFDVTVDAGTPHAFVIRNTASASGTGATAGRPVAAVSPEVTATVYAPFAAELSVTPERPVAGEPAVLELDVVNQLDEPVDDVVVTVEVPGADVLSATVDGGRCTVRETVRCTIDTLAPGETARVRVRVRPFDAGVLRPEVTVRGAGVAAQQLVVDGVRVRAGLARLAVRKRADVRFAAPGRVVDYRIVVTAARTAATAHAVRVCDAPGAGLRLLRAPGGVVRDGRACWRIRELAPGHKRTLRASARVRAASGVVRNVARVRAANLRAGRRPVSVARTRVVPDAPAACAAGPRAHAAC